MLWRIVAFISQLGDNIAVPFVNTGEDHDETMGEVLFLIEPLLSEEAGMACSQEEETKSNGDIGRDRYFGVDYPDGIHRDARTYARHIEEQKNKFMNKGDADYKGIDSPEWKARRKQHIMESKRYPEYAKWLKATRTLFALTCASLTPEYFDLHVPKVTQGDGAMLWRRMKAHDLPQKSTVAFESFSKIFSIQMGSMSLTDYYTQFTKLKMDFERQTSHIEGMEIGPKVWILLFCDRVGDAFKDLLATQKALDMDIYSKSLDELYDLLSGWARDKGIANEPGKKGSAAKHVALGASGSMTKNQLKRMKKKVRKQAKAEALEELAAKMAANTAALAAGSANRFKGRSKSRGQPKCHNCGETGHKSWECSKPCQALINGRVCGSTKHRAYKNKQGEIACGRDGYTGPSNRSNNRHGAANAAATAGADEQQQVSKDAILAGMTALLGCGMQADGNVEREFNGSSIMCDSFPILTPISSSTNLSHAANHLPFDKTALSQAMASSGNDQQGLSNAVINSSNKLSQLESDCCVANELEEQSVRCEDLPIMGEIFNVYAEREEDNEFVECWTEQAWLLQGDMEADFLAPSQVCKLQSNSTNVSSASATPVRSGKLLKMLILFVAYLIAALHGAMASSEYKSSDGKVSKLTKRFLGVVTIPLILAIGVGTYMNGFTQQCVPFSTVYKTEHNIENASLVDSEWSTAPNIPVRFYGALFEHDNLGIPGQANSTFKGLKPAALGGQAQQAFADDPVCYLDSGAIHCYLQERFRPYIYSEYTPKNHPPRKKSSL